MNEGKTIIFPKYEKIKGKLYDPKITIDDALKWLDNTPHYFSDIEDAVKDQEVRRIIKEALEKQCKKKPIRYEYDTGYEYWNCPICGQIVDDNYCGGCGNAIDWSEDEKK